MALSNYTDLAGAVAAYTKRGDTASYLPIWLSLLEGKLNRELVTFRQLTRTTLAISAEFTAAPAGLTKLRSARLIDSPYWDIACLSGEQMSELRAEQRSGQTSSIALIAGQLCVNPVPSAVNNVELVYYSAISPLSASSATNAILTNMPDLYLFGVMAEAADFYEDDEALEKYSSRFADALLGYNQESVKAEMGFNLKPMPGVRAI